MAKRKPKTKTTVTCAKCGKPVSPKSPLSETVKDDGKTQTITDWRWSCTKCGHRNPMGDLQVAATRG